MRIKFEVMTHKIHFRVKNYRHICVPQLNYFFYVYAVKEYVEFFCQYKWSENIVS